MASRSFRRATVSVAEARQFIAETLDQISEDLRGVVALLVSELATNALLYGPNGFEVSVECSANGQVVRVGVSDPGDGRPTMEHPEITTEHGRGLQLVGALSERWGIESVRGRPGKTVWFVVTDTVMAEAVVEETPSRARLQRDPPGRAWRLPTRRRNPESGTRSLRPDVIGLGGWVLASGPSGY
jgi:anti-sigma regulatory factor (Ser/Thr protein kinase)